ncbi:MAG: PDR/VanB family oxidoreductase, partial [Actinomycetota bacterium]|nr:PDR/VanB family oxidoreductase [Actinomycetota bacterium]
PAVEAYGLVWSGEDPAGRPPSVPPLDAGAPFGLRNLPVNAGAELTIELLQGHRFQPTAGLDHPNGPNDDDTADDMTVDAATTHSVTLTSTRDGHSSTVVFFVQPVDAERSVIRGVLTEAPPESAKLTVLRHHADALGGLVVEIEAEATSRPAPEPMIATIEQVDLELAAMPEVVIGRDPGLRVRVARKWTTGRDVAAFELEALDGQLPTFQPGAHIDVHLPNGLIRQYSITNGPGETANYRIGVKLEPESSGGSTCLHDTVREGDVLAISEPRNNFPLRRDPLHTVLVAGGIGVTPLLAMAQALANMDLSYELHVFARSSDHLAFAAQLGELGESVTTHYALSPEQTGAQLQNLLAERQPSTQLYVCGPGPMLEATRQTAEQAGWPDDTVHFEYFKNTNEIDHSSSFEIELARSALSLTVPSGSTILDVLRANEVPMPSSCEQGACGSCVVAVLDGEPDHQDVHLNSTERAAGDRIITCVSRAKSRRLVLDL